MQNFRGFYKNYFLNRKYSEKIFHKKAVHYTPPAENRINKTLYDNMVLENQHVHKGLNMNFDFLKYINFNIIVTETKKLKQDECLMFFIFCMSFVFISSFLWEKEVIKFNIFIINTVFYAAALVSLLIFLIKFYRKIKEKIAYNDEIHNYCSRIDELSSIEKELLHRFVLENSLHISCGKETKYLNAVQCINIKFWQTNMKIQTGECAPDFVLTVNETFYNVLEHYFKK